jgi:hypothetical protein
MWNVGRGPKGDSCSSLAQQCLCIAFPPCLNEYFYRQVSPLDSSFDSLSVGVPPKSPDHQDVNTSSISIQTHREAHSPTMSGDFWHYRYLSETSANSLEPLQRFDIGAQPPLHLTKAVMNRFLVRQCGNAAGGVSEKKVMQSATRSSHEERRVLSARGRPRTGEPGADPGKRQAHSCRCLPYQGESPRGSAPARSTGSVRPLPLRGPRSGSRRRLPPSQRARSLKVPLPRGKPASRPVGKAEWAQEKPSPQ